MAHRNNYINTGITAISKVDRGTHICHFFKGREDLTDVIIPFIRAGLVDNEKCILLTSDLLERNDVYRELNITVTDTNDYINSGQLVVADHNGWHTEGGRLISIIFWGDGLKLKNKHLMKDSSGFVRLMLCQVKLVKTGTTLLTMRCL